MADRISGGLPGVVKDALVMFGRVPFAFYVAHLYLIHSLSVLLGLIQGFSLVVTALYPLCRWVAGVKARRRDWWLSYV